MRIVGTLHPDRLTCTDRHLPGCHNPWHDRTWCLCGTVTWHGNVGTWHSYPVRDGAPATSDGPTIGWDTYFLHAPDCHDRTAPCVPGCHLDAEAAA